MTTALYASTSAWTFLVTASVSIAAGVVVTDVGLAVTPLSVRRTPGIAFSMMFDCESRATASPSSLYDAFSVVPVRE